MVDKPPSICQLNTLSTCCERHETDGRNGRDMSLDLATARVEAQVTVGSAKGRMSLAGGSVTSVQTAARCALALHWSSSQICRTRFNESSPFSPRTRSPFMKANSSRASIQGCYRNGVAKYRNGYSVLGDDDAFVAGCALLPAEEPDGDRGADHEDSDENARLE